MSNVRRVTGLVLVGMTIALGSCTPEGALVSETECDRAVAQVALTWRVNYYRDRNRINPDNVRTEEFGRAELTTTNGEPPAAVPTASDMNGVWFPPDPAPPTTTEVEQARQTGERFDPPELQRTVRYDLQCQAGNLATNADTYRQVAATVRQGRAVRVSYSLGRVLQVIAPAGDIAATDRATDRATGQPNVSPAPESERILYVDSGAGNNQSPGSAEQPFQTIAHALTQANGKTLIQLRPGVYSAKTGEVFPLVLKPGITLAGAPTAQGEDIQVTGGGKFLSPTWAGQNVTIVAVDNSQISGLTLTNPTTRGTAVWVETGAPLIRRNRFVGSDREGVFVSGTATPTIQENIFEQNGGNGLSFTRDSGGVVEGNEIRTSGFGVAIGDRSAPRLIRNQISQNKDGLVINGESQPMLQGNTISDNGRDGMVVTNTAKPTLKQNTFSDNDQYDLHNATNQPLQVEGVDLARLKVEGRVN